MAEEQGPEFVGATAFCLPKHSLLLGGVKDKPTNPLSGVFGFGVDGVFLSHDLFLGGLSCVDPPTNPNPPNTHKHYTNHPQVNRQDMLLVVVLLAFHG